MQVRLNEKGLALFGWGKDRVVANFSNARAFALMEDGYAAKDGGFMSFFRENNPHNDAAEAEVIPNDVEAELEALKAENEMLKSALNLQAPDEGVGEEIGVESAADVEVKAVAGDGLNQGIASEGGMVVRQKKVKSKKKRRSPAKR